ncbi:TPA: restriction endonuclease subunit S [Streptococcus suis]|nr:restriction endonuclease subunit S [Streptococcus suis]
MTRMKDSGIEWIGEVPEEWGITKIKFTTQLNGRIGWQGLTSAEYKEEGPYLITGTDFLDGKINFETAVHIDEKRWFEAKQIQVENGDLLITKDGTVGKVAIIEGLNEKASLNSGVLRIQTTENISRRFLFYVLKSDVFWLWFNYTNSGASTILHLYQNVFDEFSFTFPNVSEQTQIADFLDKKVDQLDKVKSLLEEQIKTLEDYRQSLIYETVTKGLDKTVPLKDSGVDWIGQIPEGWGLSRLKAISSIERGASPRPIDKYIAEDGVNWIRIGDAKKGSKYIYSTKLKITKLGSSLSKYIIPGTLILSNSMSFGQPYITSIFGCIHDGWLSITPKNNVLKEYLYWTLLSEVCLSQFKYLSIGAVVENLSVDKVGNTVILLPSLSEQKQIANFLDKKTEQIDQMISIKKEQIENINKQRQTLIYDYVTGKRRV